MKILFLIILFAASSLAAYELPQKLSRFSGYVDVWLFVGQSNMVGQSTGDTAIYTLADYDALLPIYKRVGSDPLTGIGSTSMSTLAAENGATCASEYGFLRTLYAHGYHRVIGLKHATNGKGLYNWWLPGQDGYTNLLESIADFEAEIAPLKPRYLGILWVQGTNDSNQTQEIAEAYQGNLTTFMTQLRADLGSPSLAFISPQHPPSWSSGTYAATIRSEVTAFAAADAFGASFDVSDTTDEGDDLHYDAPTGNHEIIGTRAAEAYLNNLAN